MSPVMDIISEISSLSPEAQSFIHVPQNEEEANALEEKIESLLDEINGDFESNPELSDLLNTVSSLYAVWEDQAEPIEDVSPIQYLTFLMDQHNLKQADMKDIFGSQSNVSEIISGKRDINARMARELGKKFNVNPGVFI